MKCILCGTENNDEAEVCSKCGKALKNNPVADKLAWLKKDNNDSSETVNTEEVVENIDVTEVETENIISETIEEVVSDNIEETETETIETEERVIEEILTDNNEDVAEIGSDGIIESEVVKETENSVTPIATKTSIKEKTFEKFDKLKSLNEKVFSTKNMVIALIAIIALFFVGLFVLDTFFSEDEEHYSVAFESLNALNIHNSVNNKKYETINIDEDFDFGLVKASDSSYYYPDNISVENGIIKFDIIENNGKEEERKVSNAYDDYLVSEDGRYIVYFTNVGNFYGEDVADMYYIDTKKDSAEQLISSNVIISSVKISDESDEIIYVNAEEYELFRYSFGKSKPKSLDDNVDDIIYVSDDLKYMLYVKPQKEVGDMYLYQLNSVFGNDTKKIASNVVKDSIYYSENGVVYLKAPKNYPSFNLFSEVTSNLSRSEIKELKENFDQYCNENFFTLYESDFKGSQEIMISENVHKINYVSEDGEEMVISRFKDVSKIDKNDINTISDLVNPKNIETYVVDANRNLYQLERLNPNKALSVNENYGYNEELQELYYIDGNNLAKFSLGSGFTTTVLAEDVKKLWYADNNLIYLNSAGELYQIYNGGEPKLVDDEIIVDSISLVGESLYYEKKAKNEDINLYAITEGSKPKKLSDNLVDSEYTAFDDYIYFVDEKDGLSYYDGNKVRELDKNAKEVHLITNGLQGE